MTLATLQWFDRRSMTLATLQWFDRRSMTLATLQWFDRRSMTLATEGRSMPDDPSFSTQSIHGQSVDDPENRPASLPIYQSAGWVFRDLDEVDAIYERRAPGAIYGTDGLPNILALEAVVAKLEATDAALATSGGMAAFLATFLATLSHGDRVVASRDLYGNTTRLLDDLKRFGISTSFVDATDLETVRRDLADGAKLVVVETISNPRMRVAHIPKLAALAHERGALLVVDNTFAGPYHCQPSILGADVIIESVTKFFGGHHDLVVGAVAAREEILGPIRTIAVRSSMVPGAFDAWLAARSIQTLEPRMERSARNASELASWLAGHDSIRAAHYPGLADHPDRDASAATLRRGHGAMLAFEIDGGREAVNRMLGELSMVRLVLSLGGTATTLSHPATSSHRALSKTQREALGIHDGFLRLSVGIEALDDIKSDLARGLSVLA